MFSIVFSVFKNLLFVVVVDVIVCVVYLLMMMFSFKNLCCFV